MKQILLLSTLALATMCKPACMENAHPAFLKEMTNKQKTDAAALEIRGSNQITEPLFPDVLPAVIHQLIKQYWTDPLEYIQAAYTKEVIDRHKNSRVLKITPDNI